MAVNQPSFAEEVVTWPDRIQWPDTAAASPSPSNAPATISISGKRLDAARNGLSPSTGSSIYNFDQEAIKALPQGEATPLNQVLLQAPGVVQDSYGQLHVRGDHGNVQYRLNGVVIPEPIAGFGQAISTRLVSEVNLLTGALPAQYGYRTAGMVDIKTHGVDAQTTGGDVGMSMGGNGHRELNGHVSGVNGDVSYFLSATALENKLGIENPSSGSQAIHDQTQQGKGFGYLSYLLDANSRVNVMFGVSHARFQIPTRAGLVPSYTLSSGASVASQNLNANQLEKSAYQVLSFQRGGDGALDYQVSGFRRTSTVGYTPDSVGDLIYNGIAGTIQRKSEVYGLQLDSSYKLNALHTLRSGLFMQRERFVTSNNAQVFPADNSGNQTSGTALNIQDNSNIKGPLYGFYVQDEYKPNNQLTLNYGARFDRVNTVASEQQLSPRLGAVYELSNRTRLHAGYARYFTPPPTEKIDATSVALFANTTNALPSHADTSVKSERSNYFDVGLAHQLTPKLTLGLDAYYRQVQHLQDEGQFGNALIYSAFNFQQALVKGLELTATYRDGGFSSYGNLAWSQAVARGIESGQFNFPTSEQTYIANNWVHVDHDQTWTSSGGVSYRQGASTYSADMLLGSGMRNGFANTSHLPGYAQFNAAVLRHVDDSTLGKLDLRAAIVNLFDRSYQLRDGTGIGVGAPQFGQRRTLYLSLSKPFSFK